MRAWILRILSPIEFRDSLITIMTSRDFMTLFSILDLLTTCLQPESVRATPAGFESIIATVKEWCPGQLDEGVKCADPTLPHQSQERRYQYESHL